MIIKTLHNHTLFAAQFITVHVALATFNEILLQIAILVAEHENQLNASISFDLLG